MTLCVVLHADALQELRSIMPYSQAQSQAHIRGEISSQFNNRFI